MGFSSPYGLFSLLVVGLLVLFHLRRRRQQELEVSSLLLWELVDDEPPRGRFRPNLLFLLQLALLGALGFAAARPYWVEPAASVTAARAVLVFDTSASMQMRERGERRFDQARRQAGEILAGLDPQVEIMLIAVSARPRVVVSFTRDRSSLARALEGLEPDDGPTRLELGVELAHSLAAPARGPLEIDVLTDVPRRELTFAPTVGERLRYIRFGQSDDNVALAALRVYQNPFQTVDEASAYAVVQNYAHTAKDVRLHVTLSDKPVLDQALHLGSKESRVVNIDRLPEPGRLEARLEADDGLAVDNRALAFVHPVRTIRVLAVSPSDAVLGDLRALARGVPALDLNAMSPAEFRRRGAPQADVAIFHGFAPTEPPTVNTLYVYPPAANPLFPATRDVLAAQILDWNESDPILEDLRYLDALPLDRSRMLDLPVWAHPLIESRAEGREFPLAFAGQTGGRRVICFAFDLEGRSLARSENLSLLLLVLNSLRWLTPPDSAAPVQVDVGDTYREAFAEPVAFRVTDPGERVEAHAATRRVSVEIARRGEYRVQLGGRQRIVYANLFDGDESDVGREDPPGVEIVEGEAALPVVSATLLHEFGGALLAAAFLVALLEWIYWMRSLRRGGGSRVVV